jgi:hypothetical protein
MIMNLLAAADPKQIDKVVGTIKPPDEIKNLVNSGGTGGVVFFLNSALNLIYVAAGIVFVFMIVTAAFQWITSGGDKESIAKARTKITQSIVGIFILALAFVLITLVGRVTGITFFQGQDIIQKGTYSDYNVEQCNKMANAGYTWNGTRCVPPNDAVDSRNNDKIDEKQLLELGCQTQFGENSHWNGTKCEINSAQ